MRNHETNLLLMILAIIPLIALICIQPALSVGIGQYNSQRMILFKPGLEMTYSFYLYDSSAISASLEGDLIEYATIKDPNPNGGPRNIEVELKLPEYIEPGMHTMYLVASQTSYDSAATIGGIAQVKTSLGVYALYPGKVPEFVGVTASDININDKASLSIQVINRGEETISSATGTITIYNQDGNVVAVLKTDSRSAPPFENIDLMAVLDAAAYNLSIGTYKAVGSLSYEDGELDYTKESSFTVGQMKVDIIDTTSDVIVNATNKYHITLESDWAGTINDVYTRITMPNGKVLKSPSIDLVKSEQGKKASGEIELYMETEGMDIGTYDIDVTIYYKGLTTNKKVKLNVIDGVAPVIEKPKLITPAAAFIGITIIIILFVIIYFFVTNKDSSRNRYDKYDNTRIDTSKNKNDNNTSSTKSGSDELIRPPSL